MTYSDLSDPELVARIYTTVTELNDMIYEAAKKRKFTIQYQIAESQEMGMFAPYPHMNLRVLTPVKY